MLERKLKKFFPEGPRENVFPGPAVALDEPVPIGLHAWKQSKTKMQNGHQLSVFVA